MRSFLAGEGTGEEVRILGWLFFTHEGYPRGHYVRHGVLTVTECTDEFSFELDQWSTRAAIALNVYVQP